MTGWRVLRHDDHSLRAFVRFAHCARLVVGPDGAWSVHELEGRRLAKGEAVSAAAGMEAADEWSASRWGNPEREAS